MRAAVWRRALWALRTACVVPNRRQEGCTKRTRSAAPRRKCVSFHWQLAQKGARLSHRNRIRAIVSAPNLARTGLTPELPVHLSKKSFANALDERNTRGRKRVPAVPRSHGRADALVGGAPCRGAWAHPRRTIEVPGPSRILAVFRCLDLLLGIAMTRSRTKWILADILVLIRCHRRMTFCHVMF
jgi:hypothetical protein